MARIRDFAREYARRIERGLTRGLTRSQARGHPGPRQAYASGFEPAPYDPRLEEGLRKVRVGKTVPRAARSIDESPERLRRYLADTGVGEKVRGRWKVGQDDRVRDWTFFSRGKRVHVPLSFDESRKAGAYMGAVGRALDANDPGPLEPFEGDGVTDVDGAFHPFETRMNTLYRLNTEGDEGFEPIYRIVA